MTYKTLQSQIWFVMRDLCFPALRPPIVAKKRSFTFGNVKEMTNNFARVVGEGGFGIVYHGYLNQEEQVAAKVLSQSSAQGYEQFKAEVTVPVVILITSYPKKVRFTYSIFLFLLMWFDR